MKFAIDAGHGGADPGAIGLKGLRESSVTLDLAQRVGAILKARGHEAIQTREDDRFVSLETRAAIANHAKVDALVSIHCNAAASREAHGIEVWTTKGQTKADPLADEILVSMGKAFPHANLRRDLLDGDGDKEANYAVLRLTSAPAALVEVEFISHPDTESVMRLPGWRRCAAEAIADGIEAWAKA